MKFVRSFMLIAAALLVPSVAAAQVNAPGINPTEILNFEGLNGSVNSTFTDGPPTVRVGPYSGSFARGTGKTSTFSIYCVDYEFGPERPSGLVTTTAIGGAQTDADMGATKFGSVENYRQAAYLSTLFSSWSSFGTVKADVFTAIHAAIWDIVNPVYPRFGDAPDVGTDFRALAAASDFSGDGWYVLTPTAADGSVSPFQEFIVRVPEPSTALLLGTGFLLFVGVSRKRLSEVQDAA